MRHPRVLTAAGSAAAAMIAIAAFVFVAPNSRVEAATILKSFRSTLLDGFQLTFTDIGEDGVRVNGQMFLVFEPGAVGEPDRELEGLYLDARVQADETNQDVPGLDITTALSFSEDGQWLFLKLNEISEKMLEDQPVLNALTVYAEQGVLLKLDGVWEKLQDHLDAGVMHEFFQDTHMSATADPRIHIRIGDAPEEPEQATDLTVHAEIGGESSELNAMAFDMHAVVKSLLLGTAGTEEIESLMEFVEQAAQDVQVVEQEPGLHILTIRDLQAGDEDADDAEMIAAIEIEMAYREGQGIQWGEVRHIGPYDGAVRISSADRNDMVELSDMNSWIEPGVTTVFDLSAFMPMIEAAIESHEP